MSTDLEFRLPIIKTISSDGESCVSEEDCRTPKSPEHMIPPILSCPPAPRKPRRRPSCKRRLCELQLFEIVAREEVESFFRRAEESVNGAAAKRRCLS